MGSAGSPRDRYHRPPGGGTAETGAAARAAVAILVARYALLAVRRRRATALSRPDLPAAEGGSSPEAVHPAATVSSDDLARERQVTRASLYTARPLPQYAWQELRSLVRFRQLVRYLVSTTLTKERTGRVFGYLWWLLDPLLMMAVYVVLVDVILRSGGENYPLFVFSAVLAWKFFSSGVATAMSVTIGKERLMRQIAFPRAVLPLAAVLASTIHFAFGIGVFLVTALFFGVYPDYTLVFLPVIVAAQLAFTLGLAFLLAALNVFFRDLQNLIAYVFRLWFYLSPGLYAVSAVPEEYRSLYELNPFATFFTAYRDVLMYGEVPDLGALGRTALVSIATLVFGYAFFVRRQAAFAKVR